ncbi:MAG: IPT/TIG domain-containing protein [Cyclobacteriaceae bacterium]|nr:IPT/TIG domain-containing protein [Cyclobacteriaceae bacterium]
MLTKTSSFMSGKWALYLLFTMPMAGIFQCQSEIDQPQLIIDSISPQSGIKATVVTVFGKNFSNDLSGIKATINDMSADVVVSNHEQMAVVVPPGAGTGAIVVETGNQKAVGPVFTYLETGEVTLFAGTGFEGLANGEGKTSRFTFPWGLEKDADGNVYVADRGNHLIRKITPEGIVSTLAGTGTAGYADGPAGVARFNDPVDIAIDGNGNLFVSDFLNTCIRKITPSGDVTTYAGMANGPGTTDGPLATARFFGPAGLAFDKNGNLFVADFFNHRIRKITPSGIVSTLAGSTAGCTNGTGSAAQFNFPVGLAVDDNNNVYVADWFNHSVRKITQAGVVTTVAGTCALGYEDGPAQQAKFNSPLDIAVDENGDLVITDSGNNRLRKFYMESNTVVTLCGGDSPGFINGIGTQASLNAPAGIIQLQKGVFAIAGFNNHSVRKALVQ